MNKTKKAQRKVFILERNPNRSFTYKVCTDHMHMCHSISIGLKCGISIRQKELGKQHHLFPILNAISKSTCVFSTNSPKIGDYLIALLEIDRQKYKIGQGEFKIKEAEEIYTTLKYGSIKAIDRYCLTYDTS